MKNFLFELGSCSVVSQGHSLDWAAGVNQTLSGALALLLLPCILWTKSGDRPGFNCRQNFACTNLYTVHFVVWFGDVDTSAGGSTKAGGLSHALPTYDPRDTLAWLCQKHRSCRQDQPSLCSGYHRQEMKVTVRPCGETRWPHASPPRMVGRSQQQELATALVLVGGNSQDTRAFHGSRSRRWYTLQHSCWMV